MILLVGDIHLSDKAPSSCTETYCDDLFDLLEQTVDIANSMDAIPIWAGDVFHVKTASKTSHRTVQRAIRLIDRYKHPLRIVPGNHDMSNDRFQSLYETQPLGVLLEAGARLLKGWDEDIPVYGVPWMQGFGSGTLPHEFGENLDGWGDPQLDQGTSLMVAHAPLYPPGGELSYENIPMQRWADEMGNEGNCYYGHVHDFHGINAVGGVTFCNAGAITRGSLTESHLTRKVLVTTWNERDGFSFLPLKYKPAEEVFRLTEVIEERETTARLDEFLGSVDSTTLTVTSVESVIEDVRSRHLEPAVEQVIVDLLESAS